MGTQQTTASPALTDDDCRALFEQCPVGLAVLGLDRRIVKANAAFVATLGYSQAQIAERVLADLLPAGEGKDAEALMGRLSRSEDGGAAVESRFQRRDGSVFWGALSAALIRDESGEGRRLVAVLRDISLRKKAEADLLRSNAELELYASIAAHDLQEPVRKILTYGEILGKMSDGLPPDGRTALEKSRSAARRMKELIDDLLEYARVNAVRRPSAPVDLNVVLKEVLDELSEPLAASAGKVAVGPLPVVDADELQMRQLFRNLVANAIKFTEPGRPPAVTVTAETLSGGQARVEVKDEGIGFDEKYLDRIFRPFQRVCDKNAYPGSGIGLAICQGVVQRHGGSITARSAPGKGASFRVVLPLPRSAP
ncbi:MAG: PAS domain S-box protein [Elusimicrobia bacterium]|nr:PAS domain S-box protein [Elusimicrobiota bacterium]